MTFPSLREVWAGVRTCGDSLAAYPAASTGFNWACLIDRKSISHYTKTRRAQSKRSRQLVNQSQEPRMLEFAPSVLAAPILARADPHH